MKIAIYPGSFDPITLGHLNIIKRAAACFDKLIVCVMVNASKKTSGLFTPEERVELLKKATARFPNVEVDSSNELLAAYAKRRQITRQDIDAVTTPQLDAVIFQLTDAIATKNFDRSFQILGDLLHMQRPPISILASLSEQVRKLYTARLALEEGKDINWFMELWAIRWHFQAEKLYEAARRFSYEWYHWALLRCEETDLRLKSTGADGQEVLVELLLEMAQHQVP